jgi:Rho family, other
MLTVL